MWGTGAAVPLLQLSNFRKLAFKTMPYASVFTLNIDIQQVVGQQNNFTRMRTVRNGCYAIVMHSITPAYMYMYTISHCLHLARVVAYQIAVIICQMLWGTCIERTVKDPKTIKQQQRKQNLFIYNY